MKICAISDQHGFLPEIPECDVLLIAGDICDHGQPRYQLSWLDTTFRYWLKQQKVPVFACAGNHDWPMERYPEEVKKLELPWTYLEDSWAEFQGLKIYGSPHQPRFFDWAFNLNEHELMGKWNLIPDDTDILITHGPPKYYGDLTLRGEHVGSESLTWRIQQIKPKLCVFGHIHPARGEWEMSGGVKLANVVILNDRYKMVHKPWVWELET